MKAKSDSHLYSVQPDQGYFDAGTIEADRQVLMGLFCPNLITIVFDRAGRLLKHEARLLEFLQPKNGVYDIYDVRIPPRLKEWQVELGFRPGTIRIRRFFIGEYGIGIEDYPDHFGETLDDPDASEEEKADMRESIELWDAEGQIVLLWGNDYWLNRSGDVVSS